MHLADWQIIRCSNPRQAKSAGTQRPKLFEITSYAHNDIEPSKGRLKMQDRKMEDQSPEDGLTRPYFI